MRILWQSVSPFATSGYGTMTSVWVPHLKNMGHEMAIFAYFGVMGSKLDWGDIPMYPNNNHDYGVEENWMFYDQFKPDILISLTDTWVLQGLDPRVKWIPWVPIDHDPAPPRVLNSLRQISFVKAIAMSKFGQNELTKHGIPSYYIPLIVNTNLFSPREDLRKASREVAGWNDKFVIGTVAVNCPRKNYPIALQAVKQFAANHNDVIYYLHTNPFDSQGYNLDAIRIALDMKDITLFPPPTELVLGIPRETMVQMYNSLDVFLLPSKGEGFG